MKDNSNHTPLREQLQQDIDRLFEYLKAKLDHIGPKLLKLDLDVNQTREKLSELKKS